jgi:prefoldin subunit 5
VQIVSQGLADRSAQIEHQLCRLAYKRLTLSTQIDEIDKAIATLEAMARADEQTTKDLETQAAVDAAKATAEAKPPTRKPAKK